MVNLLVVDDEKIAVKGITVGIDWEPLSIGQIFEALDVMEAKQILTDHRIDIMISDIEMPGANGLQLQEWVRVNSPHTETIFLTGHANFEYAQQAIRLGSFDYVLKPVDHDRLQEIVKQAIEKIQEDQQQLDFHETYKMYYSHWVNELPTLVEKFWQELLNGKIPANEERLTRHFQMYDIPLQLSSTVLPILISVEQWKEELNARDEEIMEYAIRKAATEIIVVDQPGCVIQENGSTLVLLYFAEGSEPSQSELKGKCEAYISACHRYFQCSLSCYLGEKTPLLKLASKVADLFHHERNNVTRSNCVLMDNDAESWISHRPQAPTFSDWIVLLEAGKKGELVARIQETINRLQKDEVGSETVEAFYYGLLHVVYHVLHKKGLAVHDMLPPQELQDYGSATRSLNQLRNWAIRIATVSCDYMNSHLKGVSAVTAKVCQYIDEHMQEELSREELAASVYLNPAYLSRLFKKETGLSISEYSMKVRMEKAKKLLSDTNDKISFVAEQTGYSHFSFFAKMFKKYTGLSPQEYRKNFNGTMDT
ncbi:response regulator transcription factor [Paenibacillus roseipurpureus]|uniref:Response regulator n=1 Tax=Paenibacillus roseopurpureus TaxID=2918901 RepID=A0AA96LVN8_9BACL|nr:helix-turn-helix domain-containing protein [Paenibacillus sp. MBLB1832]WNR45505.1 response regulator [Paenibacillus sp. MBLB1832]